jgi:hypothetical protein
MVGAMHQLGRPLRSVLFADGYIVTYNPGREPPKL